MITNFLNWTQENENTIDSFIWKETPKYKLLVHDTGIVEYIPTILTDKQFVLSCAIHGNETAPIEVLNDILTKISEGSLEPIHSTLFIFGNPKAINLEKRFSEENLNRLFAGGLKDKEDNYETIRARRIISLLDGFYKKDSKKFHDDLHTAIRDSKIEKFAMSPFNPTKSCPDLAGVMAILPDVKAKDVSDPSKLLDMSSTI